ncbi:uncharacterized protein LY89DRAFT_136013 [Mollisia scopiformis]|uniref:Uncharacterized protein n=1 Tax=Mollisia scopiformis TaxID=149040 RepID=A0A194X2A3_MOLSC|nr:uncharacterized protein LY89DRAFT_136013 [Mollisia scopiformis]KUJ14335.1 hypothetical protein LY89DRAFT_136013 [Mollisia scopiformis]
MVALAPVSVASIVIGFISFSFTLAIWLHAFWESFVTIGQAPEQLQDALSTLRQALYEEREYLKRKRRRGNDKEEGRSSSKNRPTIYYEGGPTKVINDAVKDLIREFKAYERPFLETEHTGREKELEWSFDATQQYYKSDFVHRVLWLRSKGGVETIAEKLQKIQTRRIAVEVTEMHFQMSDMMGLVRDQEGRLRAIEERLQMSRVGWDELRRN